ncbi:uncharacterized protein CIMG_12649 [Coccidioides immitis RS]|uniref:Uncharacterized protein n=1 Tax=Coccidioides immitis (strain RS) TaxID=246410 RepID=A0A0D8JS67_COCIM|nr:uncharacterized protein CIMG_12649 [Coccidioides immitis RS]KJF59979.1 hypothetical protein CIMG_12649 [Coccidioides immitis RS]
MIDRIAKKFSAIVMQFSCGDEEKGIMKTWSLIVIPRIVGIVTSATVSGSLRVIGAGLSSVLSVTYFPEDVDLLRRESESDREDQFWTMGNKSWSISGQIERQKAPLSEPIRRRGWLSSSAEERREFCVCACVDFEGQAKSMS